MNPISGPPGFAANPPLFSRRAAALLLILSFGCAAVGPGRGLVTGAIPGEAAARRIAGVPFVPGDPGACGPAALASVLGYWGETVTADEIARAIGAPSLRGVLPLDLVRYAASRGPRVTARAQSGSLEWLRARVVNEEPVVVFLDLGVGPIRRGHFVVVVGVDDAAGRVLLYSGRDPDAAMTFDRFTSAWARTGSWALVVDGASPRGEAPSPSRS